MVEAGELIKFRYNFITLFRSSWSKPFIVEAGELISSGSMPFIVEADELIRYNFQSALREFWVEASIRSAMRLNLLIHLALLTVYYVDINNSYVP